MANIYKIVVTNESKTPQTLFFFQEPATYSGGPTIYTNSLASMQIAGASDANHQVTFSMELQYYAGVQTQPSPPQVGVANVTSIADIPIDVTASDGTGNNLTKMSYAQGLDLSPPVNDPGVQLGAFRIAAPSWDPDQEGPFNAGLAALVGGNDIVLSNFITAQPHDKIDVQPIVKFYVATGSYQGGTVVDFTSSSVDAACCDATRGHEDFAVTYTKEGNWQVTATQPSSKAARKLTR